MPTVEHGSAYPLSPCWRDPWAEHLAGWSGVRHEPNVLLITYEQLKRDHAGMMRKIAEFDGRRLDAGRAR